MFCFIFIRRPPFPVNPWPIIAVSFVDFFAMSLNTVGIYYLGSAKYQLVYSSVVVFTAMFSRIFIGRKLRLRQWMSLFLIVFGLAVSSTPRKEPVSFVGLGFTACGTIMFALEYVMHEFFLKNVQPEQMGVYMGMFSGIWTLIYINVYALRNVEGVTVKLDQTAYVLYLVLILGSLGHSWSYFRLVKGVGATYVGILQAVRAISVFFASSLLFCAADALQCFTSLKFVSSMIVVTGVILFALPPKAAMKETLP